jgi:hypothetical protein
MAAGVEFVDEMFAATSPARATPTSCTAGPNVLAHRLGVPGSHNDVITTVTNNTVYVDVAC